MSFDFANEIRLEFLSEARELLENTETYFLELEKNPRNREIIDRIFRLAHTLKGSGLAAGFESLGQFSHKFEELLSAIRSDQIDVNEKIIDTLLLCNDTLKKYVEALEQDHDAEIDTIGAEDAIKSCYGTQPQTTKDLKPGKPAPKPEPKTPTVKTDSEDSKPEGAILIVDDEHLLRQTIKVYLRSLAKPTMEAGDGMEALEIIKNHPIDLILSDVRMPKMTGIEFVAKVREFDNNIPVVFFSGAAEREDFIQFMELGAYGFLEKPVLRDQTVLMAKNALSVKKLRDATVLLSRLNFRAYVYALRISNMDHETDEESRQSCRRQLEAILNEVASVTNEILGPETKERSAS